MQSVDSVVVVTGAFGALGSAVARAFGQAGARLALVDVAQPATRQRPAQIPLEPAVCIPAIDAA